MMRLLLFLQLLLVTPWATAAEPLALGTRLELFVDDYLIDEMSEQLHKQLHKPEAQEVVLVTDEPWEGNTSAYYTIFQDDDLYRMYYRGSHADPQTQRSQHPEVTCYAESRDGIHWTKPELGIVEYDGSKANNILLEGLGAHCFVAFKDPNPNCSPEARYKGISRGRPVGSKGLYVFQSADATNWSLIRDEPVITQGAFDSQNLAFWDPVSGKYVDYHRSFIDGVRAIMTCHSDDYINWTTPVPLEYPDAPTQHLYTNAIRPYPRASHIRIGFPTRYLPDHNDQVEPLFMSSRDGVTFHRWNEAIIPTSAPSDRDGNRSNYMANALLKLPGNDREYSVYATEAYYEGPDSRLRRFTYRVDGFVSINAGRDTGEFATKPIIFEGSQLAVNYVTRGSGHLRVQIESDEGETLAESQRLQGDEITEFVRWKSRDNVAEFSGQPVVLRFELNQADLFSIQFQQPNQRQENRAGRR